MISKMTNPLSVEHLLRVREIYRTLRHEREELFGGLQFSMSWLRIRYLKRGTIRTMATASFDPPTLSLHRDAFDYNHPVVLRGLIHHELIHFILGPEIGHSRLFSTCEREWCEWDDYRYHRGKFVRLIEEHARSDGRLHRYECPNCEIVLLRSREMKPESACSDCCESFNDGVWSESYILRCAD